jgi:hypothetical protein
MDGVASDKNLAAIVACKPTINPCPQNAVKGETMARLGHGLVVMTAILVIIAGSVFVGSRAAGLLFKAIPLATAPIQKWMLEPAAYWLSGFSYGRRIVDFATGISVPAEVTIFAMIMTAIVLVAVIGMAALKAVERLTQ